MSRTITNPETGERIEFGPSTDERLRFDYTLEPGGYAVGRIDHVHPRQTESFAIRSGQLGVRLDGDEWTATPGTRFAIPPGTPHTVWNDGPDEMRATVEIRPPLDIARFFETMYGLASEGRTVRWGLPRPLQLLVVADAFRDELVFARIPRTVQRLVTGTLAPIGRLVGLRARYSRFEGRIPAPS